MMKPEICGFFVCRDFVWAWKFPYGASIFGGKSLPLGSQCHSSLLLYVLDLCISMSVCLPLLSGLRLHFLYLLPVPVQCWDIVRPKKYCWMSKWIIEWLSGYTQRSTTQNCKESHYASRRVFLPFFLNSLPFHCYILLLRRMIIQLANWDGFER